MNLSIEKIDEKIHKIYYEVIHNKLPKKIRKKSLAIFYSSKLMFISRLKHLQLSTYYIQGTNKINGSNLNVAILGDEFTFNYLQKLLFSDDYNIEHLGKTFIWNVNKKLNKLNRNIDFIFVRTDRFFSRKLQNKGFIILPEWIGIKLNIDNSSKDFFKKLKKSAKEDVRIVKKHGYSYEISKDQKIFDLFYKNIYKPYIIKRHGKLAAPYTLYYPEIKSMFENGFLLLVKKQDKIVAGIIINVTQSGKAAYLIYTGVDIKNDYLSKAAGPAAGPARYYFVIKWAKKQGLDFLNFGGVRPFFNDGLFKYKTKWGTTLGISKKSFGIFGFKICNHDKKTIVDFLEQNPFIYIEKDKLKGMLLVKEKIDKERIQKIWNHYKKPGLSNLTIISTKTIDKKIKTYVETKYRNKITLKEKNQLFQ